jgi:hypothetical protein
MAREDAVMALDDDFLITTYKVRVQDGCSAPGA